MAWNILSEIPSSGIYVENGIYAFYVEGLTDDGSNFMPWSPFPFAFVTKWLKEKLGTQAQDSIYECYFGTAGYNLFEATAITEPHISYSEVTEEITTFNQTNGYNRYYYSNYSTNPDKYHLRTGSMCLTLSQSLRNLDDYTAQMLRFIKYSSTELDRGLLLRQESYDTQGNPVQSISYKYNEDANKYNHAVIASTIGFNFTNLGIANAYAIYHYPNDLREKTISTYTGQGIVTETEKYYYDAQNRNDYYQHHLLTKEEHTSSNGDKRSIEYKRPLDYLYLYAYPDEESRGIYELRQRHIFDPIIEQASYIQKQGENNKKLTASTIQTYRFDTQLNRVFAKDVYHANVPETLTGYTPSYINSNGFSFVFDRNLFTLARTYDLFDSQGNVLQYTDKTSNTPVSFIWGYNRSYPIAQIVGERYTNFANYFGGSNGIETMYYWGIPAEPTQSTYDNIHSLKTLLPNAKISIFTYKPLFGITSKTDPRGLTATYEYDAFGRLQTVKDESGKSVEGYEYRYKN